MLDRALSYLTAADAASLPAAVQAEALRALGAPVHICPEQGFVMKNLVQQIKRELPPL